jgi:hypothetical protein
VADMPDRQRNTRAYFICRWKFDIVRKTVLPRKKILKNFFFFKIGLTDARKAHGTGSLGSQGHLGTTKCDKTVQIKT